MPQRHVQKITESAILYRLAIYDFNVYSSMFDGDRIDFIVEYPRSERLIRLQVKTCKIAEGAPCVPLIRTEGHNTQIRYLKGEFNFIVGYNIFTDTAYVFSEKEVENNKTGIAVTEESKENWKKILRA